MILTISLKGAKSRWHGYLQSLPRLVDVPLFWMLEKDINEDASNAVTWLRGTEAEKVLHMRGESRHLLWVCAMHSLLYVLPEHF